MQFHTTEYFLRYQFLLFLHSNTVQGAAYSLTCNKLDIHYSYLLFTRIPAEGYKNHYRHCSPTLKAASLPYKASRPDPDTHREAACPPNAVHNHSTLDMPKNTSRRNLKSLSISRPDVPVRSPSREQRCFPSVRRGQRCPPFRLSLALPAPLPWRESISKMQSWGVYNRERREGSWLLTGRAGRPRLAFASWS